MSIQDKFSRVAALRIPDGTIEGFGLAPLKQDGAKVKFDVSADDKIDAMTFAMGTAQKKPEFDPNNEAAWTMKLSDMRPLWEARFGDTWVNTKLPDFYNDMFWAQAADRMANAGLLEVKHAWAKIKEKE